MKMPSKEEATAAGATSSPSSSSSVSDDEYVHPDADHLLIRKDRVWPQPSKIEDEPLPQPKEWPEGIVISGISGRYPESDNLEEFWDKLIQGVELISSDDRRWPVGESKFNFFLSLSLSPRPASPSCSPCNTTNIHSYTYYATKSVTDSLSIPGGTFYS